MASNVGITDLFYHHRLPDGGALLLFLLYIPCGVLLLIVRFFFVLQLFLMLTVLPKMSLVRRVLLRISCTILGIAVTQEGSEYYYSSLNKPKVIISNHVTALDNIAIETILPSIMPFCKCECPWLIKLLLGYKDFDAAKDRENMDDKIKEYLSGSDTPLLVFPEDHITNGKRGLLKFNPWGFQFSNTILPVLISVRRPPMAPTPPSVLMSGWWQDVLWSMFVPYTHYRIRVLPPIQSRSDDFSNDVQKHMASVLGVAATAFTAQEVNELIRQTQAAQARAYSQVPKATHNGAPSTPPGRTPPVRDPSGSSPNTRLTRMVQQVKEVLPQVPPGAIARDLSRTHCVDTTITNILEGRVTYVPESEAKSAPAQTSDLSGPFNESQPTKQLDVKFSRVPEERQALLDKRKAMMIESARRRFATKEP